jgi:hypothetical protein
MNEFLVCTRCHRHVKLRDAVCPFCHAAMPRPTAALLGVLAVGVGVTAAACGNAVALYGAPCTPEECGSSAGGSYAGAGGAAGYGGHHVGHGGAGATTTSAGDAGGTGGAKGDGGGAQPGYGGPPMDAG